jgi:hypothetical protein
MSSASAPVVPAGRGGSRGPGSPAARRRRRRGVRVAVGSLVLLAAFLALAAGGYFYISRVAVGIGRVPVLFATGHAASRPVPAAARPRSAPQR